MVALKLVIREFQADLPVGYLKVNIADRELPLWAAGLNFFVLDPSFMGIYTLNFQVPALVVSYAQGLNM